MQDTITINHRLEPDTKKAIELFMERLPDAPLPDISRVLLYGSHARGDNQPDSDIDIAVVLSGSDPNNGTIFSSIMELGKISYKIMFEMEPPKDVQAMIVWEDELLHPDEQNNPQFYRNIQREGIAIE